MAILKEFLLPTSNSLTVASTEALGLFKVTGNIVPFTAAAVFDGYLKKSKIVGRFDTQFFAGTESLAAASVGCTTLSVRLCTEDGPLDILASSVPVGFAESPLAATLPHNPLADSNFQHIMGSAAFWEFMSQSPESLPRLMAEMVEPPAENFRAIDFFSTVTKEFTNARGQHFLARLRLESAQKNNVSACAAGVTHTVGGAARDLTDAIDRGDHPRWLLSAQLMTQEQVLRSQLDPLDKTKEWSSTDFPPVEIGKIKLTQMSDAGSVGRIAFSELNTVPGIATYVPTGSASVRRSCDAALVQAGDLFRQLSEGKRRDFFSRVSQFLSGIPGDTVQRQLDLFKQMDAACERGVREALQRLGKESLQAPVHA